MSRLVARAAHRVAYAVGTPFVEASLATFDALAVTARAAKALPASLLDVGTFAMRFELLVVRCARLVALASFAAGAVMAMQFGAGMGRFGAKAYVPTVVATSVISALAPMLAALMTAARSGGGLAAEIAGMVITQQIDAVKALGSDPDRKLHAPSIAALVVGMPILTVVAAFAGLAGGLVIETTMLGLPVPQVLAKTAQAIQPYDATMAVLKTVVAGFLIGVIGTREGLRAHGGTSGIGAATTAAVIRGTIAVLLADLVLTKLIWMFK
jgi:phospholipid/cholesterol/gamma-HCH transport system permease protein